MALGLFVGHRLFESRNGLYFAHDVLADAVYPGDHDLVGDVDADQRRWIHDQVTLEETSSNGVAGEDRLAGRVVNVTSSLSIDQSASHRLRKRHGSTR